MKAEKICMNKEKALDILRELTTPKIIGQDEIGNGITQMGYSIEEYQEAVEVFSSTVAQNTEMKDRINAMKTEISHYKKVENCHKAEEGRVNIVTVHWWDGYMEVFEATEVRFGSDLLWMRLKDGNNRHIPLRHVRWFGTSIESHERTGM